MEKTQNAEQVSARVFASRLASAAETILIDYPKEAALLRIAALEYEERAAAPEPLPRFMVEKVQQAIQEVAYPQGMSLHDGRARIDASILARLLVVAAAAPASESQKPPAGGS